jgi:hypothetical protein
MTSMLWHIKDNLNILADGRRPQYFGKMKDDINFFENGRRPQYFGKWKTNSTYWQMEEWQIT